MSTVNVNAPSVSGSVAKKRGKTSKKEFPRVQMKNEDGTPKTRSSPKDEAVQLPVFEDWSFANLENWTNEYERPNLGQFGDPLEAVQFSQQKLVPLFTHDSDGNGHLKAVLGILDEEKVRSFVSTELQSEYDRLSAIPVEQRIAEAARKRPGKVSEAEKLIQASGVEKDVWTRLAAAQASKNLEDIQAIFREMEAAALAKATGETTAA